MEKSNVVTTILIITLVLALAFFIFRNVALTVERNAFIALDGELQKFFSNANHPCTADDDEPGKLKTCLASMNKRYSSIPVEETAFQNVDLRTNASGFLVIKNKADKDYDGTGFVLYHNLIVESTGCDIQGVISKDYTCKLALHTYCAKGDVLEVKYDGQRVHVKNC